MKRCPRCEFIYEDDQSLCDMDGVLLVYDSRTLPHLHALQTVPAPVKTARRNRAVPAFATLILALVLGMVYYVSTQRRATPVNDTPPPTTAASTLNPVPEVNPTPEAQPSAEEPKPSAEEPQPATKSVAAAAPVKKTAAKPAPTSTKARTEEKKDDSKVGNILKKTGRILKKPFKF
jgi:outer membrane biosynthesis protein TonB